VIHLVTAENARAYEAEILDLHHARKRVFVDQLGWKLRLRDGAEYDEYDDERAMNAIGFDIDGKVAMNGRFRPTDDNRSMLMDHFAHSLWPDVGPINGPKTWEFSRALSLETGIKRHNLQRKAACMLVPLEVALEAGVERYIGFADLAIFPFFVTMGWRVSFLGDPIHYGEGDGAAFTVEVSEEAVQEMRSRWGLKDPAHIYLGLEDLNGVRPLERAVQLAAEDPGIAALMPQRDPAPSQVTHPRRQRPQSARALARLERGRRRVNQSLARTS
jgi:acyl homoserine lactone synthase